MKTHLWERPLRIVPSSLWAASHSLLGFWVGVQQSSLLRSTESCGRQRAQPGWRSMKAVVIEYLVSKGTGTSGSFQLNNWGGFERKQWKLLKVLVAKKPVKAPKGCGCEKEPKEGQGASGSQKASAGRARLLEKQQSLTQLSWKWQRLRKADLKKS